MEKLKRALGSILIVLPLIVGAQTPTVTGDNMICPNGTGVVTTQTFDTYQWLRRYYGSGTTSVIAGETNQSLTMDYFSYAASYVSVVTSLAGVVDTSDEYFVDGWMFTPPYVMSSGNFTIGGNGESIVCPNDTIFFELNVPYTTNITWYKDGNVIPGANSNVLAVTQDGVYYVEGAPSQCPNYIQGPGVNLVVNVLSFPPISVNPFGSFIQGSGSNFELCPGDTMGFELNPPYDANITWYKNTFSINGSNDDTILVVSPGTYSVKATPAACPSYTQSLGGLFVFNCTVSVNETDETTISLFPNPSTTTITIETSVDQTYYAVYGTKGEKLMEGYFSGTTHTFDISMLPEGIYYLQMNNSITKTFQKQ